MIISDEQAKLAAAYIRERGNGDVPGPVGARSDVSEALVEKVRRSVESMPETRTDRVAEARSLLHEQPGADAVASKMLSRIVSDSLR